MGKHAIEKTIHSTISTLGGGTLLDKITAPFQQTIHRILTAYDELCLISRRREAYNASWAFTHAFEQMHALTDHIFSVEVTEKIAGFAGSLKNRKRKKDILRKYEKITSTLSDLVRKTGTSQKLYRTTVWAISLAEGFISLVIVLSISEMAAAFNKAVSLPQLSLLFLMVFGSLRLVLERLKNRLLLNWRWRTYQDSVDNAFDSIAKAAGISCILAYHIRQGTFLDEIDDILEVGMALMSEKPGRDERRRKRAAHRSARLLAEQRALNSRLEHQLLRDHAGNRVLLRFAALDTSQADRQHSGTEQTPADRPFPAPIRSGLNRLLRKFGKSQGS